MKKFIKITGEKLFEILDKGQKPTKYLVDEIVNNIEALKDEAEMIYEDSIINCESPIEQLLSMYLDYIDIENINKYNPFIEVVDIEKQQEIQCNDKKYRVDFLIPVIYRNQENKTFIVECDGYEFHQKSKEQIEKDNIRMRNLQKEGYEVIRFSGTEIWHKPYKCALEVLNIILSKCKYVLEVKEYGKKKNDRP